MKFAIDARGINWYKGTGIGTYTEKILKYLVHSDTKNQYHLYWSGKDYDEFQMSNSNIIMTSKKHTHFFEQYYFPCNLEKAGVDLYHVPQNGIGLSKLIKCKKVVTIHDLIPYIMPETVGKSYLQKFIREIPEILSIADGVITVSEWSKQDILRFFPFCENKTFVTPLAADKKYRPLNKEKCKTFLRQYYNIDTPFILYIGGFSPRKNVRSLLTAFAEIYPDLSKPHSLVIVGAKKEDALQLNTLSNDLAIASKIIFTGFVEEDVLPILYNACEVFVYPSFYEGFGLPPLEAMSCGTPVITSNVSSIPEVVANGAILLDPYDTKSLKNTLLSVLSSESLRSEWSLKALERSSHFSWSKTAEKTLEIYSKICNSTI